MQEHLADKYLDEINYLDVLAFRGRYENVSTANRYNATITGLFNQFEMWNELGNVIRNVKLPRRNPGYLAEKQLKLSGGRLSEEHLKRKRVPSKEGLLAAKKWCLEHDSELWEAIKQAIITTQRKRS